ncbi:MAG: hypothetical protein HA494_01590 [Thaumarchaeota archaeon]|jgi:hypothetical protein|nr:hypothetical protein [Nitrososphaerota archaeon]
MTLGFVIFYRVRELSPKELEDSKKKWEDFKQKKWPKGVKLVGEYDHAFGIGYNGFFVVEAEDYNTFLKFYDSFRDHTRWYVTETRTITGVKQ